MTITILAVLADRHGARSCLEAAFAAARAVGGEVAALHVAVDPATTILPTEEILTDDRRAAILHDEAAERRAVRDAYDAVAADLGPAGFRWIDAAGTETTAVDAHAAGAALIAIAVPERHYAGDAQEAFHAALFDTGRPVLIVPRSWRHRPVRRIAVGWHQDAACRRAVVDARPWLDRAEAIRVLAIDGSDDAALDGARGLFREIGITPDLSVIDAGAASWGDALLSAAGDADWLVMGAFRRGRFLDWLFGSVSETVLRDATMPVFLAH